MRFLTQFILLFTIPFLFGKSVSTDISPEVWYCNNTLLKQTVARALSNDAVNQNIDEIQAYLENSLLAYFTETNGKWLISVSKFHRVSGYIDDAAANSKTFCAINDSSLEVYVVVMRVE
ncbi:unnamed protein product [Cylicocyclus nassatus]|uniref:Uncharacterized protein n=1 Tax=Cylicocyclus nassatus TaxID=53992 RepID=A0AA36H163_CYLNA|nr:unnamed protein product [Cylicocyclus nassatus]